jgi:ankyrin repeat protein
MKLTQAKTGNKQNNENALHFAAECGAPIDTIKALIDAGADPTTKNTDGKTPADFAHQKGHSTIAAFIEQFIAPTKSANLMV